MVNLTTYELRLIPGKRGIKNYKNMSREKLLNTVDESEHNFNALTKKGLEQIAKMQNISQNDLDQVIKMQNQEQITKMRRIKNYKNKSKEGLLIALLRSEQSLAELYNKVEETKKYPDHDVPDYEGIRDIENVFGETDEDFYKPVKIKSAFKDNYIDKVEGTKTKIYHQKNILT